MPDTFEFHWTIEGDFEIPEFPNHEDLHREVHEYLANNYDFRPGQSGHIDLDFAGGVTAVVIEGVAYAAK